MKKTLFLYIAITMIGLAVTATITVAATQQKTGRNYVEVDSCRQTGSDIMIRRFGKSEEYRLTSSIRDAGHGLRSYALHCVSPTRYVVSWREVERPRDTVAPTMSVTKLGVNHGVNGYTYSLRVVIQDELSPITKIKVFRRVGSTGNWLSVFEWSDAQSQIKRFDRTITTPELQYSTRYDFYAQVWDSQNNSRRVNMNNVYVNRPVDIQPPQATIKQISSHEDTRNKYYVYTIDVAGTDDSRIAKMELYQKARRSNSSWVTIRTWTYGSTGTRSVTEQHVANLAYNSSYDFQLKVWDSQGNSTVSPIHVVRVPIAL